MATPHINCVLEFLDFKVFKYALKSESNLLLEQKAYDSLESNQCLKSRDIFLYIYYSK